MQLRNTEQEHDDVLPQFVAIHMSSSIHHPPDQEEQGQPATKPTRGGRNKLLEIPLFILHLVL